MIPPSPIPAVNVAAVPQRSPLRYPGGKTWLVPHIRAWLGGMSAPPRLLVEPFAGGGIVSLTAVMESLAERCLMAELDRDVAAFWKAALRRNADLARLVREFVPSREAVQALERANPADALEHGFRYEQSADGRLGAPVGEPVIVCPSRFEEDKLLVRWLAEIVGFEPGEAMVAREVPFMEGTETNKAAGKIDLVVAKSSNGGLAWHGLEIHAVYFSGEGMQSEFESLGDEQPTPPFPNAIRRPDWRSSSAKRLMPQLQIKAPTLRRWGSKIAVAVDRPFFDSIGGPSPAPSRDLNDSDVIWLVPELVPDGERNRLVRGHWEVLTLEQSGEKLLAARTVRREAFEQTLRAKLRPLGALGTE